MGRTINRHVSVQLRMKSVTQSRGNVPVCPGTMETAVISNFILKLEEKGRKKHPLFGFETQVCPEDRYGQDCVQQCSSGSGQCDLVTGGCQCPSGQMRARCQQGCPQTLYGTNCELKCSCKNGELCSPVDGSCTCGLWGTGNYCEKERMSGHYGPPGARKYQCIHRAHCNPPHGSCTCPSKRMCPTCEENDLDNPQ
ncbi:scavenger receptor class F member 2-like [Zalophus californianus]|uniref:Scavenger receptor class F member 2-like n=1 Tax=Zalophus californianus TaxID=9704 RepID=A0A6J2CKG3_ZALCA|nr:scavenger receptor class F member 2-like [Zalophus californianus]